MTDFRLRLFFEVLAASAIKLELCIFIVHVHDFTYVVEAHRSLVLCAQWRMNLLVVSASVS